MAGRPQKPTNLLELSGAFEKNPQRMADRPAAIEVETGIGRPPKHWRLPESDPGFERGRQLRRIWKEIARLAPWLVPAQRMTLEDVCVLRYRARNETLKPSELNLLRLMSNSLGMDGVGRKSAVTEAPKEVDPRDAFERRRG